MSETETMTPKKTGGAFADALTFMRIIMTPIIMAIIIFAWPNTEMAILASALFVVAAITDFFDDYLGGNSRAAVRKFGWADDAADTVLIIGTLGALGYVTYREGILLWPFAVPAGVIIARELIVGLFKGFELSRFGWPDSGLSNAKAGISMLAVCLLVASPWLTQALDLYRAEKVDPMSVFNEASPWIWYLGQGLLWVAAILSLITGLKILTTKLTANDS